MRKLHTFVATGFLAACLFGNIGVSSQSASKPGPTDKPFLWRIEGTVPSYLYGTIHLPDPAVLELPGVVRRALDAADVFNAEIPLDTRTQVGVMVKMMLPPGQDLRTLAGDELFGRMTRALVGAMGGSAPPGDATPIAAMLSRMKPWAAMSQIAQLEFLPDVKEGRQSLDATLFRMASLGGKEVGGLETVDEQVAVFDAFSFPEQIRMLAAALDEFDRTRLAVANSKARSLIALYLGGNLDSIAANPSLLYPDDAVLRQKFITHGVDERNTRMAERIAGRLGKTPAKSYFFAVGVAHFGGETGIISQLAQKGFKITRLSASDAGLIVATARRVGDHCSRFHDCGTLSRLRKTQVVGSPKTSDSWDTGLSS